MVVTDLDGTLLNDRKVVSEKDYSTLLYLGEKKIPRIVATGRSPFSASKVLREDFPIDYLVFSSGAGCLEWKKRKLLFRYSLSEKDIRHIFSILTEYSADFFIHYPIPDNHHFIYFRKNGDNLDFQRRIRFYEPFGEEGGAECPSLKEACQFLVIRRDVSPDVTWERLKEVLPAYNVIRATSPLDGNTEWIEIFPSGVSKALACEHVRNKFFPYTPKVLVVGNDYNDLQMLRWADISCVVENAPPPLREEFITLPSNNENGFSAAVSVYMGQ